MCKGESVLKQIQLLSPHNLVHKHTRTTGFKGTSDEMLIYLFIFIFGFFAFSKVSGMTANLEKLKRIHAASLLWAV